MEVNLLNNSIVGSKDDKGIWIYKSNPNYKGPFKQDGSLTQHQKDQPRFNVIIEAEDKFVDEHKHLLVDSVKEMFHILNSFGN